MKIMNLSKNPARNFSGASYAAVAKAVQEHNKDHGVPAKGWTPSALARIATLKLGFAVKSEDLSKYRVDKIFDVLRELDAATPEAQKAGELKLQAEAKVAGVKHPQTLDLLVKAIVRQEVEAAEQRLGAVFKQALAQQTVQFQVALTAQQEALCKAWGIPAPTAQEPTVPPVPSKELKLEQPTPIAAVPKKKVLLYGLLPEQRNMVIAKVKEAKLLDAAEFVWETTRTHVPTLGRNFDLAFCLSEFTDVQMRKDLKNHTKNLVVLKGAGSAVAKSVVSNLANIQARSDLQ